MSQLYTTVLRKNPAKPQETPRYYAVARSGRSVAIKEVAKRISERSSYSRGELEGCISEFMIEIMNVLEEGNIIQLGDLGNFRMTIRTGTPTMTAEEFKSSCIAGGNIVFYPGKELRDLCKRMVYTAAPKEVSCNHEDTDDSTDTGNGDNSGGGDNGGGDTPLPEV